MKDKILLVDNEKGIVTMFMNFFEMLGYLVHFAYGGKEALPKNPIKIISIYPA